jgi:hypothetical protein
MRTWPPAPILEPSPRNILFEDGNFILDFYPWRYTVAFGLEDECPRVLRRVVCAKHGAIFDPDDEVGCPYCGGLL